METTNQERKKTNKAEKFKQVMKKNEEGNKSKRRKTEKEIKKTN